MILSTTTRLLIILLISIFSLQYAWGQGRGKGKVGPGPKGLHKKQCILVLQRTHFVMVEARKSLKLNQNYTGKFAKARLHQRVARQKCANGQFLRAIHHSRYARILAFQVIKENKGVSPQGYDFNPEETQLIGTAPVDAELEKEAQAELPNEPKTDQDALKRQEKETDVSDLQGK